MNAEKLVIFCENLFRIFNMPIRIYKEETIINQFENFPLDLGTARVMDGHLITKFLEEKKPVNIYITEYLLTYGYIYCKDTGYSIVLGPVKAVDITEHTVDGIVKKSFNVPQKTIRDIYRYINIIPLMQTGRLIQILCSINLSVNNEITDPESFYEIKQNYSPDSEVYKKVIAHSEKVSLEEIKKIDYRDFEKKIEYCIKNGMTDQIKSLWKEVFSRLQNPTNSNVLRLAKDNCIMAIGIISKTALDAGYEPEEVYKLREIYIQQAEMCHSVDSVLKLRFNIIIDFTERVREMLFRSSDNPMVDRVMKYISENVEKKISLDELAGVVKTNKTYLCSKFNESVGMGVSDYINLQKIGKAKQMLRFTDKSLVDISIYFSFSSQSYFQKIFKKVTGITPLEYRKSVNV